MPRFHAARVAARGFNRRLCQEALTTGPKRIAMYDTTLRDGTQGEGVSLSLHDKLLIAERVRRRTAMSSCHQLLLPRSSALASACRLSA